jgi:hypothetical protein
MFSVFPDFIIGNPIGGQPQPTYISNVNNGGASLYKTPVVVRTYPTVGNLAAEPGAPSKSNNAHPWRY